MACSALLARSRMGPNLGDDLAEVDLADVGRGRQELGLGMAQECRADGTVEIGDRRQQGG
jgi:hypothetical protein